MAQTLSTNDKQAARIVAALEFLGEASRGYESVASGIRNHDDGSTHYMKPERATYAEGAEIFSAAAAEEREEVQLSRTFNYRPLDGAHATARALFEVYGHPGFGRAQWTMFGKIPPQRRVVNVSPTDTVEVPWGQLDVPDLKAVLTLGATRDEEKGILFEITANCRKKMEKAVTGLFNKIESILKSESIYKGKAITGAEEPEFLDLTRINEDEVIFKDHIQQALEHEVWFTIENYKLMLADRQPTRWVSLLAGDYGTGKTLATMLTAKRCERHGITFIQCRPAQDNLEQVMQTAMLYSPAVVAYEDVETAVGSSSSQATISRMLEAFDGIRSKGADVQVILTSNRPEEIDPGIIRAGRVHTYLKFEGLDAEALGKLITVKVGAARLDSFDAEAVFQACKDYSPSFMDLVIRVSQRYALSRNHKRLVGGDKVVDKFGANVTSDDQVLDYRISTQDLVSAAERLHPQWLLMQEAKGRKGANKPSVESVLMPQILAAVRTELHGTPLVGPDGNPARGEHLGALKKATFEKHLEKVGSH
jgi:transitional endoplasmic reticulum ATPase